MAQHLQRGANEADLFLTRIRRCVNAVAQGEERFGRGVFEVDTP